MAQALTQRAILLSSAARYFPPQAAFLKLFYKNGDANSCLRWDDSPLLSAARPHYAALYSYRLSDGAYGVICGSHSQGENLQGKALQDFVIDKIDDLKGQDIIAIDVKGKSSITDCMIICTGTSSRNVMSIAYHVFQESRKAGMMPLGVEGENAADWIVVDLGDVIVHVMQEESRHLYELEKLWG